MVLRTRGSKTQQHTEKNPAQTTKRKKWHTAGGRERDESTRYIYIANYTNSRCKRKSITRCPKRHIKCTKDENDANHIHASIPITTILHDMTQKMQPEPDNRDGHQTNRRDLKIKIEAGSRTPHIYIDVPSIDTARTPMTNAPTGS